MARRLKPHPTRRAVLGGAAGLAAGAMWPGRAPAVVTRDGRRPVIAHGVASGDVTPFGAMIWSRADRPAAMRVEWSTDPRFEQRVERVDGPAALVDSDFTAKMALRGLPAGADVHYRVAFRAFDTGAWSEPAVGRLRTPSTQPTTRPTTFAWSGDTCGQGFGIPPEGGMVIHDRIRETRPDVFIHCGDLVYADGPIRAERPLDDGRIWRNVVIPEKAKVAETLAEFRANFRYNLMDAPFRRLLAEAPMVVQWDDHETKNNWWPGRVLADRRYRVKEVDLLAARARRAFFDYTPIARQPEAPGRIYRLLPRGPLLDLFVLDARSYRSTNNSNDQPKPGPDTAYFGDTQLDWLCRRLQRSTATWKLIACDQPLSLHIGHHETESLANARGGRPLGREHELAKLLTFVKTHQIRNVVFVTADVHYAAAHHFDPKIAAYKDFDPFWEFVAGPLNAGTFGPNPQDPTFGPVEKFVSIPRSLQPGRSPLDGHQFFGTGSIDPRTRALTVKLHDITGKVIYQVELGPR